MARVFEQIEIALLKPEDAEGVGELFKVYYGDGYPIKTFYDAQKLIEANEAREIITVVGKNEAGKVVGHAALYYSAPYKKIYELGAILVHPEYQRKRCSVKSIALAVTLETVRIGLEADDTLGIWGEAVCNHTHTQKFLYRVGGFYETAFEVDLMPAEAYDKSGAAEGRVSTLLALQEIGSAEREVFVPQIYREQLEFLYEPLNLARTFKQALSTSPADGTQTSGKSQFFEFAQTSRVTVQDIGADFGDYARKVEEECLAKKGIVFQYWLPLDSPQIEFSINILRERGYFLGGILPFWNDTDSLLMQKVESDTDWQAQRIFSERGKSIVAMVRLDAENVK